MWRFAEQILPDLDIQCHSIIQMGGSPMRVTALSTVFTGFSATYYLSAVAHFVFLGQFLAFLCLKMSYLRIILAYFVPRTKLPCARASQAPATARTRAKRARKGGVCRAGARGRTAAGAQNYPATRSIAQNTPVLRRMVRPYRAPAA